jgi:deoxyribodipyrimidine photo-lyase
LETAIWWIRRDLRLSDNQALSRAASAADSVVPVFVLDPKLVGSANSSPRRLAFLYQGIKRLDADLRRRGSRLILRRGNPAEVLSKLIRESGAEMIFAEEDFSPYAHQRDFQVGREMPLTLNGGPCVSHPESILTKAGSPYKVFSPYMRAWKAVHQISADQLAAIPKSISTPSDITSENLPDEPGIELDPAFLPGEDYAVNKLQEFMSREIGGIYQYVESRNLPAVQGTAQLSPYLRFGMVSARKCVSAAQAAMRDAPDERSRNNAETWLNELIWREFYFAIMYHFPHVLKHSFQEAMRAIPWRNELSEFSAWRGGRTGYPIVDAAMRQLIATGWMHNRCRMIAASFLVKDLVIDWRWGERFFMKHLLDGDPAANNGGWQWTAGTGTDAAPYFRVINPILQSKKFDPEGSFIRCWIPELAAVPLKFIHTPWEMDASAQQRSGCIIGRDYPYPIVDHGFARERILDIYKQAKQG